MSKSIRKKQMLWLIVGLLLLAAASWGPIVSNVEQPKFILVKKQGNIEIRDYFPLIVAEAEVAGDRESAINTGFRTIANYIFGNNSSARKVAMTAPVTQQRSEKIAMTAPVTQQGDKNSWRVRFVMPSSYSIDTLPKPNNPSVVLKQIPDKRFAVIRFSGRAGEDSLNEHLEELKQFIKIKNLEALSGPDYAFYNPPWTLPFLRRNEIMIEVKKG